RVMHRTQRRFDELIALAHRFHTDYGVPVRILGASELKAVEPALHDVGVGAIHWLCSWTVSDPGALVGAYADLFIKRGGVLLTADASYLEPAAGRGWRFRTSEGTHEAEHAVVCLGPWSADFMQR